MAERRIYFDTKSLDDALLARYVTPNIVDESSQYVEAIAQSLGVSAEQIAKPTPFLIEQLGLYWAYMTAAWRKASFSLGKAADNDSFALKYRLFKELLDDLLSRITADTFTNGNSARKRKFPATMPIARR